MKEPCSICGKWLRKARDIVNGKPAHVTCAGLASKERYDNLKAAGLCPYCKAEIGKHPDDAEVYCHKHKTWSNDQGRRDARDKWRKRVKRLGMCSRCGDRPRKVHADGTLADRCTTCSRHIANLRKLQYRKDHPEVKKTIRCGRCGGQDHNARLCPNSLDHLRPMSLEEMQKRPDRRDIEAHWGNA